MGDDISSGSVCFDFGATNVMHLSMLSIVAPNHSALMSHLAKYSET